MGGKKGNKSKKSKTKTAVQKAAEARHAKFKQTKVQTFGGKRTSFSNAEKTRIKKAGYSVDGYSKAAPNKASGYSGTSGVSVGSKIKNPNPKTTGVGPVVSGREYSDMLKANPPRFNEAGRNEVNQNIAQIGQQGPTTNIKQYEDGKFRPYYGVTTPGQIRLKEQYAIPTKTAMLGGDNLGSAFGIGSVIGAGLALPSLIKGAAEKGNELRKNLERKLNPEESQNQSSLGIGNLISAVNPVANLSNLGISPASAITMKSADSFGYPSQDAVDKAAGITAGGLNIGGSGFTPDNPSGTRSRVIGPTSEQLADTYKSTLNPDSFKGLSDGETFGSGPVASGEDYARGLNVSPYGSVENTMRSIVGKIPLVNRIPGVNTRLLTDKEIADKRVSAQNQLAYRKEMAKFRGAGGGTRLPVTPTVIEEIIPEALPVPSASTTATTQTGVDPNRLLQIQQQAYAQAYNPMLIGGFNPQFRFGAATPTIDYSTYFNY